MGGPWGRRWLSLGAVLEMAKSRSSPEGKLENLDVEGIRRNRDTVGD